MKRSSSGGMKGTPRKKAKSSLSLTDTDLEREKPSMLNHSFSKKSSLLHRPSNILRPVSRILQLQRPILAQYGWANQTSPKKHTPWFDLSVYRWRRRGIPGIRPLRRSGFNRSVRAKEGRVGTLNPSPPDERGHAMRAEDLRQPPWPLQGIRRTSNCIGFRARRLRVSGSDVY